MKKILLLLVLNCGLLGIWANGPLKKPLAFVSSDSIVVWGDDRSDFRNSALAVVPGLQAKTVEVSQIDENQLVADEKSWKEEVLPHLHLLGGQVDENGQFQIVQTRTMVETAGKLFLQTADAHYIDVVERAGLNGLMAITSPGPLSFQKHIAAQTLMNISGMVYATDDEGIFVNLYVNNSAHIQQGKWNLYIDQLTAMPHAGRVKIRISGLDKGLKPIKLRVRMPDWAFRQHTWPFRFYIDNVSEKLPKVYVNGHEETYPIEKGYWVIERRWNSGDEVFFDFPFQPRLLHPCLEGQIEDAVATLQRGPLVYGFPEVHEDGAYDVKNPIVEAAEANSAGHSILEVPVTDVKGTSAILRALPVMDGANYLWMNVKK